MVQNRTQDVAVTLLVGGGFHGLGDGAAQGTAGAGMLGQNLTAHLGGVGGGRRHLCAVGPHDLPAKGLLLIGALDHVHLAVQTQVSTGHAQSGAPLTGAGLGGYALEALLFGIIGLGNGGVQLVAAGGVVALEFIIDFGRCLELFLQAVGPDQGRRTVHLIEIPDLLGDVDIGGDVVQFLLYQLLAEHRLQVGGGHGLMGARMQQRGGLVLHIGPHVIPGLGHLVLFQVDFIGDGVDVGHGSWLLSVGEGEKV